MESGYHNNTLMKYCFLYQKHYQPKLHGKNSRFRQRGATVRALHYRGGRASSVQTVIRFGKAGIRCEEPVSSKISSLYPLFLCVFCGPIVLLPVLPILRTHHYCTISWNINDTDQKNLCELSLGITHSAFPKLYRENPPAIGSFYFLFVCFCCRYTEFWVSTLNFYRLLIMLY